VLNELFNRPVSLLLPISLQIAKNPNHPNAALAKDNLERILSEDLGDNPDWEHVGQMVDTFVKENP
jgi:hypothetical protein